MAPTGVTWDATNDRKLLLGILKLQNVSVDYAALAELMTTEHQVCTASAIQNRLKKLKAAAKEDAPGGAAAVDSDGTPRKKAATGKRGAATATAEGSPTKKSKTRKGKALKADMAAEVEQREAEDDEDAGTEPNEDGEAF